MGCSAKAECGGNFLLTMQSHVIEMSFWLISEIMGSLTITKA
jgi:hypothetical protein